MTANELADLIENEDTLWLEPHLNTIATMLRQQQAEIEALYNLVKEQDKKILELAFDLAYANRTDEFVKKARKK
jgi:hypothetical protein